MGNVIRFRRPERAVPAPAPAFEDLPEDDDRLLYAAYDAAFAAAERYEKERRREREALARIEALTRENNRLKAELIRLRRTRG